MINFSSKNRIKELIGLACLAGFIILLHWNTLTLPLIRDEGEYAYAAWLMNHDALPYKDSFMQKPPMIIYTYWLAQWFDKGDGRAARWLVLLFIFTSALLLGAIARREIGKEAVWPARWLLVPLLLMPGLEQYTANTEQFMIVPMLAVWLLYTNKRGDAPVRTWAAAGFACAVAIFYKYTIAPVMLFIFTVWIFESWRSLSKKRPVLLRTLAALAGFLSGFALIMGPFLVHNSGGDWFDCTIRFNRLYAVTHQFKSDALLFFVNSLTGAWWFISLTALIFFFTLPKRVWFFLGLCLTAVVCTAGSWYDQYYVPLMPFWAFTAAGGVTVITNQIVKISGLKGPSVKKILLPVALFITIVPDYKFLAMSSTEIEHIKDYFQPFNEAALVAGKVAQITRPDERILVAGSEPEILYYAGRKSSTRFVIFYPLMLHTSLAENYQRQAILEIEKNPPKAIVMANAATSWLQNDMSPRLITNYLQELLKNYTVIGGYKTTGNGPGWSDTVKADQCNNNCSLVLYSKNNSTHEQ
ncbi:MAG: glycosyltransferase family 39 protein [Chitinispirillaceae bacterium]|jgi:4-amino-4-deoxy-L-arabinose transferase-like glycosyltransferase